MLPVVHLVIKNSKIIHKGFPFLEVLLWSIDKYFSVEKDRLCGDFKASVYKFTNSSKQISLNKSTTKFFNSSISSTNQNNQENLKKNSNRNQNNEEKSNIKFNQNINDEEIKFIEIETDIIYKLKPSCYGCGKCDIELKIITAGQAEISCSAFA